MNRILLFSSLRASIRKKKKKRKEEEEKKKRQSNELYIKGSRGKTLIIS